MNVKLDDYKNKTIHFIGIGGCSMSGIAMILKNLGFTVQGSDIKHSSFTDTLDHSGIPYTIGQCAENVMNADLIVYSAAIKPTNPEYVYGMEHQIPMLERSQMLGIISSSYHHVLCIAGCHGKTTITSMMGLITQDAALDATVHVGGIVDYMGGGVKLGQSDIFITEACEYVKSFLTLNPNYIIINNIDDDHLDCYQNIEEIIETFEKFVSLLPADGILFANVDDPYTRQVADQCGHKVITYGLRPENDYYIDHIAYNELGFPSFDVYARGQQLGHIQLNVPGSYNALNALAAIAAATEIFHIPFSSIQTALSAYHLAARRFEYIGEMKGMKIFHDYAHHPSEIAALMDAASKYPHQKLYVLFQCNSYTRAKTLKEKYGKCFALADQVLVPDIYPGRDIDKGEIHATDLVDEINQNSANAKYLATFENIKEYLQKNAQAGDLLVTLGSGDVNRQQLIFLNP